MKVSTHFNLDPSMSVREWRVLLVFELCRLRYLDLNLMGTVGEEHQFEGRRGRVFASGSLLNA